jgi:putative transposase
VRPGGVRTVMAESLVLKQQLLISSRSRRRAPNLNSFDRFVLGLGSLFVTPSRIPKLAVILKPRTLLRFHEALKKRKYRWLFSSGDHRRPGPKGPSKELIDAIVEFKRRNPRVGCPRIAQEIAHAFGIDIDKDIVRRVLAKHYRPEQEPRSVLAELYRAYEGQPVERRFVSLRIDTPAQPLGHGGDGRVHTPDHRLWR